MTAKEFIKKKWPEGEILPDMTTAQEALDILADHFLGHENTIIQGYSATVGQWNTEVVAAMLARYPSGKIRRIHKST